MRDREAHLAAMRKWQRDNAEYCKKYRAEYGAKNRKAITEKCRKWREQNRAHCRAVETAYRDRNRKRIYEYHMRWRRASGVIPLDQARKQSAQRLANWTRANGHVLAATWTPERRQMMSDLTSKRMSQTPPNNAFSRVKSGHRADLGIFVRSAWEANYARYLNFLIKHEQKIERWEFEPETFWFESIKRGVRSYKPDFKVFMRDGRVEYHEVKGWMYPRARTALSRMKKYHPAVVVVLIDQKRYQGIAKTVKRIIPFWE